MRSSEISRKKRGAAMQRLFFHLQFSKLCNYFFLASSPAFSMAAATHRDRYTCSSGLEREVIAMGT